MRKKAKKTKNLINFIDKKILKNGKKDFWIE